MCQKFESAEINSTPTYVLLSRSRLTETTLDSTVRSLFSFTRISICPTTTGCIDLQQRPMSVHRLRLRLHAELVAVLVLPVHGYRDRDAHS